VAVSAHYEDVTTFEPMYQEEFQSREIGFEEFRSRNMSWLEDYHLETFQ
jgi:hypothetical protein